MSLFGARRRQVRSSRKTRTTGTQRAQKKKDGPTIAGPSWRQSNRAVAALPRTGGCR